MLDGIIHIMNASRYAEAQAHYNQMMFERHAEAAQQFSDQDGALNLVLIDGEYRLPAEIGHGRRS